MRRKIKENLWDQGMDARNWLEIEDHADAAAIYEAIRVNLLELGEFREGLDKFRRCLKLRQKYLGDHTLTAHSFL